MKPVVPLLLLLACAAETPDSSPPAADDTAAGDSGGDTACPPLAFEPDAVQLQVLGQAELTITGCAAGLTVACPAFVVLTVPDPAVAGDVAHLRAEVGYSPPQAGTCTVTWSEGSAELEVALVE